jgi:hypothetical protein
LGTQMFLGLLLDIFMSLMMVLMVLISKEHMIVVIFNRHMCLFMLKFMTLTLRLLINNHLLFLLS